MTESQPSQTEPEGKKRLSLKKRLFFALLIVLFCVSVVRTVLSYSAIKRQPGLFKGSILRADPALGFAPVPGASGALVLPFGVERAIVFDDRGFRVPQHPAPTRADSPLVLALGCSLTFGYGCRAEESYPYLVGQGLGVASINAGVGAFGLSQMLLRARELIPAYRPQILLLQYSPWLVRRAQEPYAPSNYGLMPVPYFYTDSAGQLQIQPPVFDPLVTRLPVGSYLGSESGLLDFLGFALTVELPRQLYEDVQQLAYGCRSWFGSLPRPEQDGEKVVREVYREIAQLCLDHQVQLFIVPLSWGAKPLTVPASIQELGVPIVHPREAFLRWLEGNTRDAAPLGMRYDRSFKIWSEAPRRYVDGHPNPRAHRLIAECLIEAIRR